MLTLQIKEKEIENLTPEEKFVRGTVGAKCQINFDEFWQGYEKYIVFKRVGYEPINIIVDSLENEIEIPYTILVESGEFKIGVFGITETETLPTLYSKDIKILYGTDTHGTTPPTYIPSEIDQLRLSKQDKLVSGENIKTVNGESVLGSGNIKIQVEVDQTYNPESENAQSGKAVAEAVENKQDKFCEVVVNGNKKTLNLGVDDKLELRICDSENDFYLTSIDVSKKGININSQDAGGDGVQIVGNRLSLTNGESIISFDDVGGGIDIKGLNPPINDTDAANKQYVDEQIGDISTALDELHAYAQAIINGGVTE